MGFFLLRRGRHDVLFLNDLADKHTIFSILNKGPWRHLCLPVSPCYETLFSCLPEVPVGTGPGKVLGTGSAHGLSLEAPGTHPALVPGDMGVSQHPHLGQREHWAPLLHQPRCKAFGHLQRADAPSCRFHSFYFKPVHSHMQMMTKQEAVQEEGSSSYYLLQR